MERQNLLQSTIELAIGNVFRDKGKSHKSLFERLRRKITEKPPLPDGEVKKLKKALMKFFTFPKK